MGVRLFDMHSHLYEHSDSEISRILELDPELVIVAVSDDPDSIHRTLELASTYKGRIVPCGGYHPWNLKEGGSIDSAREAARQVARTGLACIGEVGLDKKFLPLDTWNIQLEVFKIFTRLAREMDAFLNIHAPGAWRETLDIIVAEEVPRAMFHWYTGPLDLIDEIRSHGYYVSINPAIRIQEKHKRVAASAPLDSIVFESDSPYNYRGLRLSPLMIRDSMEIVAELKGISVEEVRLAAYKNSLDLIGPVKP